MSKHKPNKHRRTIRISNGTPTQGFDSVPINVVAAGELQISGNTLSFSDRHQGTFDTIRLDAAEDTFNIRASEVRIGQINLMATIADMTARMAAQDLEIQELRNYIHIILGQIRTNEA